MAHGVAALVEHSVDPAQPQAGAGRVTQSDSDCRLRPGALDGDRGITHALRQGVHMIELGPDCVDGRLDLRVRRSAAQRRLGDRDVDRVRFVNGADRSTARHRNHLDTPASRHREESLPRDDYPQLVGDRARRPGKTQPGVERRDDPTGVRIMPADEDVPIDAIAFGIRAHPPHQTRGANPVTHDSSHLGFEPRPAHAVIIDAVQVDLIGSEVRRPTRSRARRTRQHTGKKLSP